MSTKRTTNKKFDLAAAKEDAKKATAAMHQRLANVIATDEDWKAHLRFISRLRGYSFGNANMLWAQWEQRKDIRMMCRAIEAGIFGAPLSPMLPDDISFCAGGSEWKKMNGQINKGEKALSVIAPYTITDREKEPDPVTGKHPTKVIGFILKNRTFSINQISGVEVPADDLCTLLEGQGPEGVWEALLPLVDALGYTLEVGPMTGSEANGDVTWLLKRIRVKETNDHAQRVKTLIHEIAHILLHEPEILPEHMPRKIKEIEAESTAFTVLDLLGFDSGDYSLGYVASWSKGNGALVASTLERVAQAASRIVAFLETGDLPNAKGTTKVEFPEAEADTQDEGVLVA